MEPVLQKNPGIVTCRDVRIFGGPDVRLVTQGAARLGKKRDLVASGRVAEWPIVPHCQLGST